MSEANKNGLDVSRVFLAYTACQGDVLKAAHVLDLPVETVKDLARSESWDSKLKELNKIQGDARDVQIQLNRSVNYIQAHRTRTVLDRILTELMDKDGADLVDMLTVTSEKHSAELKLRAITDLVKAIETAQLMTARALGDTAEERPQDGNATNGSAIALQVLKAMNAADEIGIDSVAIVKKQIALESAPSV